jgi:hypothetical protein
MVSHFATTLLVLALTIEEETYLPSTKLNSRTTTPYLIRMQDALGQLFLQGICQETV